jgi:protein-S-isoprenylcysteine O-methyltransferase Ste14
MRYVFLVILWISWCAAHSALISVPFTEAIRRRFPKGFRYYRLAYNLLAVITLAPVLLYGYLLRADPIVRWQGPWTIVPILLAAGAAYFFWAGARRYDLRQFLGLRQINDEKTCSVLTDDCSLDTGGVLSRVRHPWYAGGMLIVWARPLDVSAILVNLIICSYFVVGAILEERKLKVQFGQDYVDYQRRVPMFFPVKWTRRPLSEKQ